MLIHPFTKPHLTIWWNISEPQRDPWLRSPSLSSFFGHISGHWNLCTRASPALNSRLALITIARLNVVDTYCRRHFCPCYYLWRWTTRMFGVSIPWIKRKPHILGPRICEVRQRSRTCLAHLITRHLQGQIADEYKERTLAEEEKPVDELIALASEILPYCLAHNAEAEACDLLMEVCRTSSCYTYHGFRSNDSICWNNMSTRVLLIEFVCICSAVCRMWRVNALVTFLANLFQNQKTRYLSKPVLQSSASLSDGLKPCRHGQAFWDTLHKL